MGKFDKFMHDSIHDIDVEAAKENYGPQEWVLGYCKECLEPIFNSHAMVPDYPSIFECPSCGYPNNKEDLWEAPSEELINNMTQWPCKQWCHGIMSCTWDRLANSHNDCHLYHRRLCEYYKPNKEPDEACLHEHRRKMGAWPYEKEVK